MDECLRYFQDAIERAETVPPWPEWWASHEDLVRRSFDQADYLRLKFHRLEAAKAILRRVGLPWQAKPKVHPLPYSKPIPAAKIAAIERALAVEFPADYRAFLCESNGGFPYPGWFHYEPAADAKAGPVERLICPFLPVGNDGYGVEARLRDLPRLPPGLIPIASVNAAGSLCGSNDVLLLETLDDGRGAVWFWPGVGERFTRALLRRVADSFSVLMSGLDYPPSARPWMGQIDDGDVTGCRRWLDGGGDFQKRDPASDTTPIEYAALARDPHLYLGQLWADEDGKRRREGRCAIMRLLVERGAETGRAFWYAVMVQNYDIARILLPRLPTVGTSDLREAWGCLRDRPGAEPGLLAEVEKELQARRQAQSQGKAPRRPVAPTSSPTRGSWDGPEALAWLRESANESALASNRFGDTGEAIRFVEELYAAGADQVLIPEESIQGEGDQLLYADALVVILPADMKKRQAVFRIYDTEWAGQDADLPAAEDQDSLFLWWD
jgi:hypothetical protein